ncbi:MAG: nitroreductase family protein [Muribaculaceae bacterium]|nr:nitroreductase family protein [Muribaculaceae bacterium]
MENKQLTQLIAENAAYRNIVERTSIRRYTSEPVTELHKLALINAAMSAPTGVNKQPWEFFVVDDPDLLKQLAAGLPYAKMAAQAPIAIVVCGNTERFLDGDDSTLWEQDLSAASENILLAANALGLGGVWTCLYPHPDRVATVRRILNLNDNLIPFNLIPVGHPAAPSHPMDKWHPERVHHNGIDASDHKQI